jgi:hypothetical protein
MDLHQAVEFAQKTVNPTPTTPAAPGSAISEGGSEGGSESDGGAFEGRASLEQAYNSAPEPLHAAAEDPEELTDLHLESPLRKTPGTAVMDALRELRGAGYDDEDCANDALTPGGKEVSI